MYITIPTQIPELHLHELAKLLWPYPEIIAIDGRLKRVPKKNARGEPILNPEDVQVGLNFNVISQEITDTEAIIRVLKIKENNILKILKKRTKKKINKLNK